MARIGTCSRGAHTRGDEYPVCEVAGDPERCSYLTLDRILWNETGIQTDLSGARDHLTARGPPGCGVRDGVATIVARMRA